MAGDSQFLAGNETCPGPEEIARFAAGQLDESMRQRLEGHLDICGHCHQRLVDELHSASGRRPTSAVASDVSLLQRPPGTRVADRYRIEAFIGSGGMGEVYRALDEMLSEPVAIKLLPPNLAGSEQGLQRLKSEVLLARRVGHANVCRVFDFGMDNSGRETAHFLTMELLQGGSLRAAARARQLSLAAIRRIAEQLVAGLGAAAAEYSTGTSRARTYCFAMN